jgi:hypothetical protein
MLGMKSYSTAEKERMKSLIFTKKSMQKKQGT